MGRLHVVEFTLADPDADGICESQQPTEAGFLTLDGVLAASRMDMTVMPTSAVTTAVLDVPRHVSITSDADDSGVTFTIAGYDAGGALRTEAVTGPDTGAVSSTINFKEVLSVRISAAATGNITVGTNDSCETPWHEVSAWRKPFQMALEANYLTSASMTIQFQTTIGDIQSLSLNEASHLATNAGSALTADGVVTLTTPVKAVRAKVTSFVSGTVRIGMLQQ